MFMACTTNLTFAQVRRMALTIESRADKAAEQFIGDLRMRGWRMRSALNVGLFPSPIWPL